MELIPGLPEELGLECLTRLPYTDHKVAFQVCKQWSKLLKSREFYYYRRQCGYTKNVACLVQAFPGDQKMQAKHGSSLSYGITVFDPVSQTWERLSSVPKYHNGLPLFCQLASSEGKLVVMGGWNPVSYETVQDIFVYDFTTQEWRQGKDMPSKRSFFAVGAIGSKIYIAGGHDENKNALKSAWVYDVTKDDWVELAQMNQERDECEGLVVGNEFWVISGYSTENQGRFASSCESYELKTGQWKRVEGVWRAGQSPRSFIGVESNGKPVCWTELDSVARKGISVIKTAGLVILMSGSAHQEKFQEIIIGQMIRGKIEKLEKVDVPVEFHGLVQSGCFAQI